jgi:HAD superfamily hydrolase (TIGR01509 family)
MAALRGILLDVDGTLLDSNDAHALAWMDALAEQNFAVPFTRVRPLIGMGSDKIVPAITGLPYEDPRAERLAERRGEIFRERYLPRLKPFPGARALVEELGRRGLRRVVATSASQDDLRALLAQAEVEDQIDATVSGDDVDRSKPSPDVVSAALAKARVRPDETVLVGDTPYDVTAAHRAGVRTIGVRSGDWPDEALRGAEAIFDDVAALHAHLDEALARLQQ